MFIVGRYWTVLFMPFSMNKFFYVNKYRWYNHLDPRINKKTWTNIEDALVLEAHAQFGSKWAEIAKILPGRCLLF